MKPKPKDKPHLSPAWKAEPQHERLFKCAFMLNLHGLLTEAEYQRVKERQLKGAKRGKA